MVMGSGENQQQQHMINFHINLSHLIHSNHHHSSNSNSSSRNKEEMKGGGGGGVVPKGCMAILVGHEEEEELQRFIIPIMYVKHPLFIQLLKEAEEEYGFKHNGPITIPCHVDEFKSVQDKIDQEQHNHHHHHGHGHGHGHGHHHEQHHHHHHHHNNFLCFKA